MESINKIEDLGIIKEYNVQSGIALNDKKQITICVDASHKYFDHQYRLLNKFLKDKNLLDITTVKQEVEQSVFKASPLL